MIYIFFNLTEMFYFPRISGIFICFQFSQLFQEEVKHLDDFPHVLILAILPKKRCNDFCYQQ